MSNHFRRAQILIEQRRYELAERELREGLAESPHDVWAHSSLAICRANLGDFHAAHWFSRRAIELGPNDPEGYLRLAWTIMRDAGYVPPQTLPWWRRRERDPARRRLLEAERVLGDAMRLAPGDERCYHLLTLTLHDLGRLPEALAVAERGLALEPASVTLRNARSVVLSAMGRHREASESAGDTLRIDPESASAHAVRGRALLRQGHAKEAVAHLSESLRLTPGDEECRMALVEAMQTQAWPFRIAMRLHAPFSGGRDGKRFWYVFAWAMVWVKAPIVVAAAWGPPKAVAMWLLLFCWGMGLGLPAGLFALRHLALFLITFHPQARRLLTFGERAAVRGAVYAAAAVPCYAAALWLELHPPAVAVAALLAAVTFGTAGGADGPPEDRRRLFVYAVAFAATAALLGVTAPAFPEWSRLAFVAVGVVALVPQWRFAAHRAV